MARLKPLTVMRGQKEMNAGAPIAHTMTAAIGERRQVSPTAGRAPRRSTHTKISRMTAVIG